MPIAERRRLGTQDQPHVVLDCTGGPPQAVFQNGTWNRTLSDVIVFDDVFVAENVCTGLTVGPEQRQHLHELILGAQGVQLHQSLQQLVGRIETHNRDLRDKADAIPPSDRNGLTIDQFCALPARPDIDAAIAEAERNLAAAREQEPIRLQPTFAALSLPIIDLPEVTALLDRQLADLQAGAAERVRQHLATLGPEGESWVADGMQRIQEPVATAHCPFCAQTVAESPVIQHYAAFFSEAYEQLKQNIATTLGSFVTSHGGDAVAAFERSVRIATERRQFWSRFCDVPEIALDTAAIAQAWQSARDVVTAALQSKANAPLERVPLDEVARTIIATYQNDCDQIAALSLRMGAANTVLASVKQRAAGANVATLAATVARLHATRARHEPVTAALCTAYLTEKEAKTQSEAQRDTARTALENYRSTIFPAYQVAVNTYLGRFQASFQLANVEPGNHRGGSTCNYQVLINNVRVPVGAGEPANGQPSFRTTLSAGDRNTLALAFFFASLDRHPNRANCVVVIDDPVSSLDDHRTLTTVQHLRRLVLDVAQLVILSHNRPFLCRIWEDADPAYRCALQVVRNPTGSTLAAWDANQDSITEHDKRHQRLRGFSAGQIAASREVAQAIRPTLEAFLRVAFPEFFPPGTLLGQFRNTCQQRLSGAGAGEILDTQDLQDLRDIVEYANRFHHDTNPAWETAAVNDAELLQFTNRALHFARR
jgi:wobble nucleotide-excising tRNase